MSKYFAVSFLYFIPKYVMTSLKNKNYPKGYIRAVLSIDPRVSALHKIEILLIQNSHVNKLLIASRHSEGYDSGI